MNPEFAVELLKTVILQAVLLAAPFLGVALIVGLVVSLFQAVTSINEQTLSFVPKALVRPGVAPAAAALDDSSTGRVHHRDHRKDPADGHVNAWTGTSTIGCWSS